MTVESNVPTSGDNKSFMSLLTQGNNLWIAIGVVAVVVIAALFFAFGSMGGKVAATVNGEKIYLSEVDNQFKAYETLAYAKGFLMVASSPLTRTSHHAGDDFARLRAARANQSGH